jgi:hypothetical protein
LSDVRAPLEEAANAFVRLGHNRCDDCRERHLTDEKRLEEARMTHWEGPEGGTVLQRSSVMGFSWKHEWFKEVSGYLTTQSLFILLFATTSITERA